MAQRESSAHREWRASLQRWERHKKIALLSREMVLAHGLDASQAIERSTAYVDALAKLSPEEPGDEPPFSDEPAPPAPPPPPPPKAPARANPTGFFPNSR